MLIFLSNAIAHYNQDQVDKPINTQGNHSYPVLLTILADPHIIPCYPPLSVPPVGTVSHQVRNSPLQFLSLFLRIIQSSIIIH